MTFEERIQFLLQSQESLGKNIEESHERMNALQEKVDAIATAVSTHENTMERFRRALRAGIAEWLNGNNGEEQ